MINFVLQALDGIFTIVFVVGIGYVLSKKGWFDDKSSALIAKLVTTVSLPLYMISSLTKNFTAEKLVELTRYAVAGMLYAFGTDCRQNSS